MSYNQLTLEERSQIDILLQQNYSKSEIAREIKRDKATISRELKRNSGKNGYKYEQANELACLRKCQPKTVIKFTEKVEKLVIEKLKRYWSPEQISNHLMKKKKSYVSHERIYQFIKEDRKTGGELYKYLRQGNKKRRKRYGSGKSSRGQLKNRVSIDKRPKIVDRNVTIGHWEGDTIIGKNHKGAIVTLTERKTSLVRMAYVPSKEAPVVRDAIVRLLSGDIEKVKTITFDNGKEFAEHQFIGHLLKADIYFAHPYHSWERGLNENTNGLIRQYFPKKTDFRTISKKRIAEVETALNNRPRKKLNYRTPSEVFARER